MQPCKKIENQNIAVFFPHILFEVPFQQVVMQTTSPRLVCKIVSYHSESSKITLIPPKENSKSVENSEIINLGEF